MPDKPRDFLDDKVAKGVAAAEQKLVQIEMQQFNLKIMGRDDRPAIVAVPKDITDIELISLIVGIAQVGDQLRAQRAPQLAIARQMPNGPVS